MTEPVAHKKSSKGFWRSIGDAISSAGHRAWEAIKFGGRKTLEGLKFLGRQAVRGAKASGNLALRGVGYLGAGIMWLALTILNVATALVVGVVMVLAMIIVGVLMLAGVLIGKVIDILDYWVLGSFRWLALGRPAPFNEFLADRRAAALDKNMIRIEKLGNWVMRKFNLPTAEDYTRLLDDDIVVEDYDYDPDDPIRIKQQQALEDKVAVRLQEDVDNKTMSFPGGRARMVDHDDPFAEGTDYTASIPLMLAPENEGKTFIEYDWTSYVHDPDFPVMIDIMENTTMVPSEKAYWVGRREMIKYYKDNPDGLDEHGRAWAAVYHRYRKQTALPMKYIRTGFMDMVNELKAARRSAASV
jgi:hypothetical protein